MPRRPGSGSRGEPVKRGGFDRRLAQLERAFSPEGDGVDPSWPEPFKSLCTEDSQALHAYRALLAFGQPPEKPWLYEKSSSAPARVQRAQALLNQSYRACLDRGYESLIAKLGGPEEVREVLREVLLDRRVLGDPEVAKILDPPDVERRVRPESGQPGVREIPVSPFE